MTRPVSLVIITDNMLFGECLSYRLNLDHTFAVKDVLCSTGDTLSRIHNCNPELILLDSKFHRMTALCLARQLNLEVPNVRKLLLGFAESETEIQPYIEAGVTGYLGKNAAFTDLKTTIQLVIRGEVVCSPYVAHAMFARLAELADEPHPAALDEGMTLSSRELEIVHCIAEGWSNRQIADYLYLSPHTVKNHVYNILQKLKVQRRIEAVKYAYEKGWLQRM